MTKFLMIAISVFSLQSFAAFDGSPECETSFRQSEYKDLEGKYVGDLSYPNGSPTEIKLIITGINQALLDGDTSAPLRCIPYVEMHYGILTIGRIFEVSPAVNGTYAIRSDRVTAGSTVTVWSGRLTKTANGVHVDIIDHEQTPRSSDMKRVN